MSYRGEDDLSNLLTAPDRIDREALRELRLLEGEQVERVWKTGRGFLVITNLRVVEVARKSLVFSTGDWELGPNFFFYNLAPPKVVLHRYLRLAEDHETHPVVMHLFVEDPYAAMQEVEAARKAGFSEWLRRRAQAEASFRSSQARAQLEGRTSFRMTVAKVRCDYCGNLMAVTATLCPSCGAPRR